MLKNYDFALKGVVSDEEKGDILCLHASEFRDAEYKACLESCDKYLSISCRGKITLHEYNEAHERLAACVTWHSDRAEAVIDYLWALGLLSDDDRIEALDHTAFRFEDFLNNCFLTLDQHCDVDVRAFQHDEL